jgi:hypothetical protein
MGQENRITARFCLPAGCYRSGFFCCLSIGLSSSTKSRTSLKRR